MKAGPGEMKFTPDRRTELAADRTIFAAERTYAAWVRTGLAALASGIGAEELLAGVLPEEVIDITVSLVLFFSAFRLGRAVWREVFPRAPPPPPHPPPP